MPKLPREPRPGEITPEALYLRRREFLKTAALFTGTTAGVGGGLLYLAGGGKPQPRISGAQFSNLESGPVPSAPIYNANEALTPFADITSYNNFYELGISKTDPANNAVHLHRRPWTVSLEGEIARPGVYDIDTLLDWFPLEERIYRMRCVEAWSMVIPWLGFPLAKLLARVEPTSRAKYVAFTTLFDPAQLPGQKDDVLAWPYVEGLRLDEAMHPLTILGVGLYGKVLPGQNGAPIRLVVPWKYGFKGIKSIVKIRLVEEQPLTTWAHADPREYGFYANVNPAVDHPRWSQATERRIGDYQRRPTLPFNGYAAEVASLYAGLDLRTHF